MSRHSAANLFIIGRLATIQKLNHSDVSDEGRQNAEIFYLNKIVRLLEVTTSSEEEADVLRDHPRWEELCENYGRPTIERQIDGTSDPQSLDARTTNFTFYLSTSSTPRALQEIETFKIKGLSIDQTISQNEPPQNGSSVKGSEPRSETSFDDVNKINFSDEGEETLTDHKSDKIFERSMQIPLTTSIYALKGIVGRLFSIPPPFPSRIRLIYETGEWDPIVDSNKDDSAWIRDDEDDNEREDPDGQRARYLRSMYRENFQMREEELVSSTKRIGDYVNTRKARVRVDIIEKNHAESSDDENDGGVLVAKLDEGNDDQN